jgi:hypothetical protein
MFLIAQTWYDEDAGQITEGIYLIMTDHPSERFKFKDKTYAKLYCTLRKVKMTQVGNFMVGACPAINGIKVSLSGAFGADGLPVSFSRIEHFFKDFVPVPGDIAGKYWESDRDEAYPLIQKWAVNFFELKNLTLEGAKKCIN